MSEEGRDIAVNPGYIAGLIDAALRTAANHEDAATRARAEAKIARLTAALEGMRSGAVSVGSRTPVRDTPAWATLEVVRGGFATGALLANGPLLDHERAALERAPASDFSSERAALNARALSAEGLDALRAMLASATFRVAVPEEGALLVVAWLLAHGQRAEAADVLDAIAPFFDRLRFYPVPDPRPLPESSVVSLVPAREVARKLDARRPARRVMAMRDSLAWRTLYDRVVALLAESVEGSPLVVARDEVGALVRDAHGDFVVDGGTVGARTDGAWLARARDLLAEITAAARVTPMSKKLTDPRESFTILREALASLARGEPLAAKQRHVRRVLATAMHKRGAPGSDKLRALRATQERVRAMPVHAQVAKVVAARLAKVDSESGIASIEAFTQPVADTEARPDAPDGAAVPRSVEKKLLRALEAPIEELVARKVITSGEVLAIVAPKITAQVRAAGIEDPGLRRVYTAIYAAFRKRRSLLLLDLEKQVKLHELPWVAAIDGHRSRSLSAATQSAQTLEQLATLAITGFPQAILPNKLLQELSALVGGANLKAPIVEEIAADIFMGTFSEKYLDAAKVSASLLRGTLYERYYGLPFDRVLAMEAKKGRYGGIDAFAELCAALAAPQQSGNRASVAHNGTIIEQQQLLTTHNLASLFVALSLKDKLGARGLDGLARSCAKWIFAQHALKLPLGRPQLARLKNTAYAWRQMLFFASLTDLETQRALVRWTRGALAEQDPAFAERFAPAVAGLAMAVEGGSFGPDGTATFERAKAQRFLGWTTGNHWLFEAKRPRG
jgi:hypothetical protein